MFTNDLICRRRRSILVWPDIGPQMPGCVDDKVEKEIPPMFGFPMPMLRSVVATRELAGVPLYPGRLK
jgi:hypothetical protein